MALQDYDRVIDLIEEKITLDNKQIRVLVARMLGMNDRKATEFFQNIDDKGRTLVMYISERKLCHALEDYTEGMTKEQIAEKYNYNDMSRFNGYAETLCGGTPLKMIREKGYKCPPERYIKDFSETKEIVSKSALKISDGYKAEIIRLIDENQGLREELSEIIKQNREKEKKENILKERTLSTKDYREFLKLEDMRVIYGLGVYEMINIYNKSKKTGEDLEILCENEMEKKLYTIDYDNSEYEIERLNYRNAYEMDLQEAWDCYYTDDEIVDRGYYDSDDMEEPDDIAEKECFDSGDMEESDDDIDDDMIELIAEEAHDEIIKKRNNRAVEGKSNNGFDDLPDTFQRAEDDIPF